MSELLRVVVTPGARVVFGAVVIGALVGFPVKTIVVVLEAVVIAVVVLVVEGGVVVVGITVVVAFIVVTTVVVTPGAKVLVPKRSHLQ